MESMYPSLIASFNLRSLMIRWLFELFLSIKYYVISVHMNTCLQLDFFIIKVINDAITFMIGGFLGNWGWWVKEIFDDRSTLPTHPVPQTLMHNDYTVRTDC